MFSKLYSSNLVFILLFIVSIIVDNVNGILQDMGLYTPIGAIFRIGILAFLLPCFLRLTGNQRYFLYYVLLITILFLVGLGFWTINNYTINTMVEIDAFIRLMYFYAVIAYFLVYVRNSSALKYVEYYVLTISAIVLISFITGIGNASYGETYGFGMKGYFIAGNDLGLSMVLSLLLLSISYFDRLNLKNILKLFVIVLACFALGSRVGMLGSILIIFYLSFYYIFLYSPKIQSLQSSFKKILLSLFVFLTIILTLGWIYNNAFDAYAKKRLTSKSLSSARSVLTEPAKRKIRDFSTTELFIGGGQVALLSKVANDNNLFMERRAIEADYWEIIGSYGYFLGGMIYSIAVFPIMFSLFSYYHNRTLTTLTLLLFFCLFCMIGFLAGHAIKNLMVAPVFAYAMSALFNKFDIYNNSIS